MSPGDTPNMIALTLVIISLILVLVLLQTFKVPCKLARQ